MTQQNQNASPEQGKRIEITEADLAPLAPIEVDVRAADLVDSSEPIVLDESDFPTDVSPDKLVVAEEELADQRTGNVGEIVLRTSDLDTTGDGKPGSAEMRTKKIFTSFIQDRLPDEFVEISAAGRTVKDRRSEYTINGEGGLNPLSRVKFSEYREGPQAELIGIPSNYIGLEIFDENGKSISDIRYDEYMGFVEKTEDGHPEISPEKAEEAVAILSAASDRGDLVPVQEQAKEDENTQERKLEIKAIRKFSRFVNSHLTGEVDPDGFKVSSFSLDDTGKLMPIVGVSISAGNIDRSGYPGYPDSAENVRTLEIMMSSNSDSSAIIRYDKITGFIEVNADSNTKYDITPERVTDVIDILTTAEAEGRLNPVLES